MKKNQLRQLELAMNVFSLDIIYSDMIDPNDGKCIIHSVNLVCI